MKLPNREQAFIAPEKIIDYLLSEENSDGKFMFFVSVGFSIEQWRKLENALLSHAQMYEVARTQLNPHGIKYIIEGELDSPDGRKPLVRTVWIIENEQDIARFVTAYPL